MPANVDTDYHRYHNNRDGDDEDDSRYSERRIHGRSAYPRSDGISGAPCGEYARHYSPTLQSQPPVTWVPSANCASTVPEKRPFAALACNTVTSPDVAFIRLPAPVVAVLLTPMVKGV